MDYAALLDPHLETLEDGEEEAAKAIVEVLKEELEARYAGQAMRRDAHPKAHGVVRATFAVEDELPAELAHGVFQPGRRYPAWIRFSNGDADPGRHDAKGDGRGMAIKLMGVEGEQLLPDHRDATTQDFVMISHPTFPVQQAATYLSLVKKAGSTNPFVQLTIPLTVGLKGTGIAAAITSRKIHSPLGIRYWSTVPYRLGLGGAAMKFSARPVDPPGVDKPARPGPDFLREQMIAQLAEGDALFEFLVQPRTRDDLSIENPLQEWAEDVAPFHRVATITIPKQTFATEAQDAFGEHLSFNPWHGLVEHQPLGGVNRIRRVVYEAISAFRHARNGVPRVEPTADTSNATPRGARGGAPAPRAPG